MAVERYRLRVCPATGEFEIEGSREFVEQYWGELQPLIARTPAVSTAQESPRPSITSTPEPSGGSGLPETFGEYLTLFGKLTGIDQMLVAGHFQQAASSENTFTTGEASGLLTEQGVKLSNPSQAVKGNVDRKTVFRVSKRVFRVSNPAGEERIKELLEESRASA